MRGKVMLHLHYRLLCHSNTNFNLRYATPYYYVNVIKYAGLVYIFYAYIFQHANFICSVWCVTYFLWLSRKRRSFLGGKKCSLTWNVCCDFSYNSHLKSFSLQKEFRKLLSYVSLRVKCLIFLPDFNQTWTFSTEANKSFQYKC